MNVDRAYIFIALAVAVGAWTMFFVSGQGPTQLLQACLLTAVAAVFLLRYRRPH